MLWFFNWAFWRHFFTLIMDKKVCKDINYAMIIASNVSFPFIHSLRLIMDPDVMASSQSAWWSTGRAIHQHHTVHGCGPVQAGFFQSILLLLLEKMGYHCFLLCWSLFLQKFLHAFSVLITNSNLMSIPYCSLYQSQVGGQQMLAKTWGSIGYFPKYHNSLCLSSKFLIKDFFHLFTPGTYSGPKWE